MTGEIRGRSLSFVRRSEPGRRNGFALVAALLALWHFWLIRNRDPERCFRAFIGNHWLGLAVFAGIVIDYAVRMERWPYWPE